MLRNAAGFGEAVEAHVAAGSASSTTYALTARQPRLLGSAWAATARVAQAVSTAGLQHSSYQQRERGVEVALCAGSHTVEYLLAWRTLSDPSRAASPAVRQQLGHSLKSALRHCYAWEGRSHPRGSPHCTGWALRTCAELAGLGPATTLRFLRLEAQAAAAQPLTSNTGLAIAARAGLLLPLTAQRTALPDRFFLGGVDSLRGFATKGAGPTDARRPQPPGAAAAAEALSGPRLERDALGGDLVASVTAAVTWTLPHPLLRGAGVHGHAWADGGVLLPLAGGGSLAQALRGAVGLGVVFPTAIGRLELNYCVAAAAAAHDRVKHGLQWGLRSTGL